MRRVLIYLIEEILLLTHDFADQIQSLPHLILLDVYFAAVGSDRIEVLLDLEGYLLCQLCDYLVQPRRLKPEIRILHHLYKLAVASLKQELAFLLEHTRIQVVFPQTLVLKIDDVDT